MGLVSALTAPKTLNRFPPEGEQINVLVKHHKNPKYARCTKWAASTKKLLYFR